MREVRATFLSSEPVRPPVSTCTLVARQVASGLFKQPGINPPEFVGRKRGCYQDLVDGLSERNVRWESSIARA